jgi:hypothetical protein
MRSLEEVRWNARQFSMLPKTMKLTKGETEHGDKILVKIELFMKGSCANRLD